MLLPIVLAAVSCCCCCWSDRFVYNNSRQSNNETIVAPQSAGLCDSCFLQHLTIVAVMTTLLFFTSSNYTPVLMFSDFSGNIHFWGPCPHKSVSVYVRLYAALMERKLLNRFSPHSQQTYQLGTRSIFGQNTCKIYLLIVFKD